MLKATHEFYQLKYFDRSMVATITRNSGKIQFFKKAQFFIKLKIDHTRTHFFFFRMDEIFIVFV